MTKSEAGNVNLANPFLVYTILWMVIIFLIQLKLNTLLSDLQTETYFLVLSNVLTFAIIYFPLSLYYQTDQATALEDNKHLLEKLLSLIFVLLVIWGAGTLLNILASGGVPIYWLLSGQLEKDYRHFGIPTFSGLLMALYMFSVTGLFLYYLLMRNSKILFLLLVLLAWNVVIMNRGAVTWILLQMLGMYLLVKRMTIMNSIGLICSLILFVLLFGWIGDWRLGRSFSEEFSHLQAEPLFQYVPSGFFWVYNYVTSGLNNINASIVQLEPLYEPYFSIINIFPTILRDYLYEPGRYPLMLVSEAYNIATFYAGFLADFGIMGAIGAVALLQLIVTWIYIIARSGKPWAMISYAVLFQALTLSIFADTFTSLVTIAQIGLSFFFMKLCGTAES